MYAISVSKDQKWIVHGTTEGASIWDAEVHEKVVEVEGRDEVISDIFFSRRCTQLHQVCLWD